MQGIPLHPTLGSPTRSLDEIYDRLGDLSFAAEYKYDGQRAQIHCKRNNSGNVDVHVFSRHLEDMTTKVRIFSIPTFSQLLMNLSVSGRDITHARDFYGQA